eukprot:1621805-Pyramimonas_sp.AAC.1
MFKGTFGVKFVSLASTFSNRVDPKGGLATRGWCNTCGAIQLWGCNTLGACNTFRGANVLLDHRMQDMTSIQCNPILWRNTFAKQLPQLYCTAPFQLDPLLGHPEASLHAP